MIDVATTGVAHAAETVRDADRPATAESARRFRLGHQPALDGIRAVAVISVIAFHGNVSFLRGGFLGVDIFFVLSGFLITDRLLEERISTDRISQRAFYARRALRLLPALAVVLAVVLVYSQVFETTLMAGLTRREGVATAGYGANWYDLWHGAPLPTPLSHTWSLAIEEQFYLLWPLLLVLFLGRRCNLKRALSFTLAAAFSSTCLLLVLARGGHGARLHANFGLDTRAGALLLGAAAMIAVFVGWLPSSRRAVNALRGLAVAAWVGTFVMLMVGRSRMLESLWLTPVIALTVAVILLDLMVPGGRAARVLSVRPLAFVGRISYGLYLWHWPVMFWMTSRLKSSPIAPMMRQVERWGFWPTFIVDVAVTFVLALLSYKFVELPMLRRKRRFERLPSETGN